MANNNGISIKYGSNEVVGTTADKQLVPGTAATLNTSGYLLEKDITVEFPSNYAVINNSKLLVEENGTDISLQDENGAYYTKIDVDVPRPAIREDLKVLTENNKTYKATEDVYNGKTYYGYSQVRVEIDVPDVSEVDATKAHVLAGKTFYGENGKETGELADNGYTTGTTALELSSSKSSLDLDGAYKGKVQIKYDEPRTVTANGEYNNVVGTIIVEVSDSSEIPVWDGSGISINPIS